MTFPQPFLLTTMNNLAASEKIQWLEQRHAELLDGLDALNDRLEQALNSFVKSPSQAEVATQPVEAD